MTQALLKTKDLLFEIDLVEYVSSCSMRIRVKGDKKCKINKIVFSNDMTKAGYTKSVPTLSKRELKKASNFGELKKVEYLIENGVDADSVFSDDTTSLFIASMNGYTDVVKYLLTKPVDVNMINKNEWSPLMIASNRGHYEIAELLIENEADVNATSVEMRWSPLMFAAENGHFDVVQLLCENNADILYKTEDGIDAISLASDNGHDDIVSFLNDKIIQKIEQPDSNQLSLIQLPELQYPAPIMIEPLDEKWLFLNQMGFVFNLPSEGFSYNDADVGVEEIDNAIDLIDAVTSINVDDKLLEDNTQLDATENYNETNSLSSDNYDPVDVLPPDTCDTNSINNSFIYDSVTLKKLQKAFNSHESTSESSSSVAIYESLYSSASCALSSLFLHNILLISTFIAIIYLLIINPSVDL